MVGPSAWQISYAASIIRAGGVVAYPTESVWGLGCDPFNYAAVQSLLEIKQRPQSKGLILLSGDAEHFRPLLDDLDAEQEQRFMTPTERPTTWLVPDANGHIPVWIKGEHDMVAVRVSRHPLVVALSRALGAPLVSTSANPSGRPTARNPLELRKYFGSGGRSQLDWIVPGQVLQGAQPSTIRNLLTGQVLRA